MADSKQAITSLLTEHFRYTPLTLLDDIINTVNELVHRAVNAVEAGLSNAPTSSLGFADRFADEHPNETPELGDDGSPLFFDAQTEIDNGVHQLETLLQTSVDKNFDKLEIYVLRNILSVPQDVAPWMRLGHYENLNFPNHSPTNQPDQKRLPPSAESLYLLRRKLVEARKLQSLLQSERSRNIAMIGRLQNLLSSSGDPAQQSLAFLTSNPAAQTLDLSFNSPSGSSSSPLTTQSRLVVSKLPALRQLLATLKSQAQLRRGEVGSVKYAGSAANQERREYIEERVKRRLEADGIHLKAGTGEDGVVGKTTEFGKRRDEETVASIERVSELVSSGLEADREDRGVGGSTRDMQIDE